METPMRISALAVLLLSCVPAFAQSPLPSDSKVFIEPMNGFETYLSAAIRDEHVPLVVVLDKDKADYVVTGVWRETEAGFTGNGSLVRPIRTRINNSASISIVDPKSTAVVFSASTQQTKTHQASKEVAEDLAKQLGKAMAGTAKKK
jgi:hypothetical protein